MSGPKLMGADSSDVGGELMWAESGQLMWAES